METGCGCGAPGDRHLQRFYRDLHALSLIHMLLLVAARRLPFFVEKTEPTSSDEEVALLIEEASE
jgi:hypothetical protein